MAAPPDDGLELHRCLLEGSKTASAELAAAFLEPLIERLQRNNPTIPEDLIATAAGDALIALFRNPSSYKADRNKGLFSYLIMSAQGDLLNLLNREKDYRKKHPPLNLVELPDDGGNSFAETDTGLSRLEVEEELRLAEPLLRAVREGLDEKECECLVLKLHGERRTEVFAAAMGIEHLPPSEQKEQVKKLKDKLEARIRRERSRHVEPS